MHVQMSETSRLYLVRMDPGEDVLASLQSTVTQFELRNAIIVSGIGSLDHFQVHVVKTTNMPPGNVFTSGAGPFDIVAITGVVVNHEIHAHIILSDTSQTVGGHLEKGCRVLTFGVVAVIDTPKVDLTGWDVRGPLES